MNSGEINSLTPNPTESKGSLVGSIIVILILIVGAIYLFSRPATAPIAPPSPAPELSATTTPVANTSISTTSTSTLDTATSSANVSGSLDL